MIPTHLHFKLNSKFLRCQRPVIRTVFSRRNRSTTSKLNLEKTTTHTPTLSEIFDRHRNTLDKRGVNPDGDSASTQFPIRKTLFSGASARQRADQQANNTNDDDLATQQALSALNRPRSHVLSTSPSSSSSGVSSATYSSAPPDFNYLRFALLCRSDNLAKARALFAEMKAHTKDVKLLSEVIKLYSKHGLIAEVADIVREAEETGRKFNYFDLLAQGALIAVFAMREEAVLNDIEQYAWFLEAMLRHGMYADGLKYAKKFPDQTHPLIIHYQFEAMVMQNHFASMLTALNHLVQQKLLTSAKQINTLFRHFGEKLSEEEIKVIFTSEGVHLDLRNLTPKLIVTAIETSLKRGNSEILVIIMQSLIVKCGVVPSEWYIEVMQFMMARAHTDGTELALETLLNLGIYPPSSTYNYLLKTYLYQKQHDRFDALLRRMNRDGIEYSAETYSILFEQKFLNDDYIGCMKLWRAIHRLGMLPSKYCVRVLMKMCAKFGAESELLQTIYEGEAAGMPIDVYACNSMLNLYITAENNVGVGVILSLMEELRVDPNAQTFARLIVYYKRNNDAEEVNKCVTRMKNLGMEPDKSTKELLSLGRVHVPNTLRLSPTPPPSFLSAAVVATNGEDLDYEPSPDEWVE